VIPTLINCTRYFSKILSLVHAYAIVDHKMTDRLMGTPDNSVWKDVTSLPYYRHDFPSWVALKLNSSVPRLPESGIDLLEVSELATCLQIRIGELAIANNCVRFYLYRNCFRVIPSIASQLKMHSTISSSRLSRDIQ
jgi:hypothetical protein